MNKKIYSIGLMTFWGVIIFSSCRLPYEPDIEADQEILVVDAFLTNHTGASYVKLSMAIPYDLAGTYPSVHNATVYLIDKTHHNKISFQETSAGYYEPVYAVFAGEINATYELTVVMPDGSIYVSEPETIPEDMEPARAYGGYDKVEYLTEDDFGKTVRVTEDVCAMYFDYIGETSAPRFRYNSSQLIEYGIPAAPAGFFCWKTIIDNSLRFTNEKYTSSSMNIYKQEVSTSPPTTRMMVNAIVSGPSGWVFSDSMIVVYEYKRIVEINQYRLNDDSYEYYKNIKAQSDAEGKLFDPVISQVKGNISCVNVTSKTVLGFFEASNLMTMSYIIHRSGVGSNVTITQIDNVAPHSPAGHLYNQRPDFWVY